MKFLIVIALSILVFLGFVTWIGYSTNKEPSQKNTNQIQTTATSNKYDYPAFKAALGAGFVKIKGYVHEFHEDIIAVGTVFIALFTTIAFRLIDEVLQRDPKNAMALADLAFNWHMGGLFGWTREPLPEAMERMGDAARRAVAADDQDAAAHTSLAVYELFSNRHADALRRLHRAIAQDPNSRFARGYLGAAYSFGGEPDRSHAALEEAMRVEPARLPDGNLAYLQRVVAPTRRALRRGGELRQAGYRIQSGVSGRAWHAGRVRGASRGHGGGARHTRCLCASAAWFDVG